MPIMLRKGHSSYNLFCGLCCCGLCAVLDWNVVCITSPAARNSALRPYISIFGLLNVYTKTPELSNYLKCLHDVQEGS
jgi:hypothetical protein